MPTPRRNPNQPQPHNPAPDTVSPTYPTPAESYPPYQSYAQHGAVPVAFDAVDDSADPGHSDDDGENGEGNHGAGGGGFRGAPGGGHTNTQQQPPSQPPPASHQTINYAPAGAAAADYIPSTSTDHDPDTWREWLVPAQDAKGHSERIGIRVQPALTRQLELVLQCKSWPYKTASDVIRHAIMRHLDWLARQRPDMPSVMSQVEAIAEVVRDEILLSDQEKILSQLSSTAEYAASKQDVTTVRRVMRRAMDSINGMPPGAWRDSYREKFETQFAGYLLGTGLAVRNASTPQGQIGGTENE